MGDWPEAINSAVGLELAAASCMMRAMRGKTFLVVACVASILLLQVTGLHLHVSPAEAASLHAEHTHYADPDGHGHGDDSDVSLSELGAFWVKVLAYFVPLLIIFALTPVKVRSWVVGAPSSHRICRPRWRPPLRAPPLSI
ncbi:MAG: hypothetical protein CMQ43_02925 [Gammaproteobacteria bacterium]|jgi:hypothetical protein|nr:hypothetical protein [Gammaproteobacteria bacterium]